MPELAIVYHSSDRPEVRIAHLEVRNAHLEVRIAHLEAGVLAWSARG